MKELYRFRQFLAEGVIKEEVDVLGNEFTQEIQDDMKMYYKMDVDMDDIKDWVNMYYIGYNSEYDEGPGDVDYEGNEFGSEDYESEKKELVFDTAEREDFYMHLNPEADSTFPNLGEGKLLKEDNLKDYWSEWAAGEVKVGNDDVIDAGGVDADFKDVPDDTMDTFKRYVKAVKTLNASSKELRDDIAGAISGIFYGGGGFEDYEFDVLTSDQFDKIK